MREEIKHLIDFIKFVDNYTYLLDGIRYDTENNLPITMHDLAQIYLDGGNTVAKHINV